MKKINCPLCKSHSDLKFKNHIGYQISKKYDIYHCKNCKTAFADPLKADYEIYNLIYSQIEKVIGYDRYNNYSKQVLLEISPLDYLAESEDVYWAIRKYFNELSKKTSQLKVLEVGCGFGYLTYSLIKSGINIKGIDISETAIQNAIEKYGNHYETISAEDLAIRDQENYDVIILTEVIEHIENPMSMLNALKKLLKPGGDILLTTPNRTPYPEDVLWDTEPPPVHLFWFTEQSMKVIGKNLGLSVYFIDLNQFNIKEAEKTGSYTKPNTNIREFSPSRNPRLNEKGEPTYFHPLISPNNTEIIEIPLEEKLRPLFSNIPILRESIKGILKALHILPFAKAIRDDWILYQIRRLENKKIKAAFQKKKDLIQSLKKNPKPRLTLAAILHKPI